MSDTKDMVKFLMPDGTEISNDPRFNIAEMREEVLAARPNKGDVGITEDEQKAQTQVEHPATLNSGQPGVGENAVDEDPVKAAHGVLGSPAQQRQEEDVKKAQEAGATPHNTSVEDPEPVDSNEKVEEARKAQVEAREKALKAQESLGDEGPGDPSQPYSEWSGKQLKAEALRRNAERGEADQLDLSGVTRKSQLAKLLEEDDSSAAGGQA